MRVRTRFIGAVVVSCLGAACSATGEGRPAPTVERSVTTPQPLFDPAVLREIYEDSMGQLRECIDDRRSDPSLGSDRFPC